MEGLSLIPTLEEEEPEESPPKKVTLLLLKHNFVYVRQRLRKYWLLVDVIYGVIRLVADCKSEKRSSKIYVPRDEHFGHLKSSDFLSFGIKSISRNVWPHLKPRLDSNISKDEFESFDEVHDLSEGGIKLPLDTISKISSLPLLQEIFRTDGENVLKFSVPHVIRGISYYINGKLNKFDSITGLCDII